MHWKQELDVLIQGPGLGHLSEKNAKWLKNMKKLI